MKKIFPLCLLLGSVFFVSLAGELRAVSFQWGHDIPLEGHELYRLEVADSPGFETPLLRQLVRGGGYSWSTGQEGVYYWRLQRVATDSSMDASVIASGLLIAIESFSKAKVTGGLAYVDLEWDASPGAQRYVVKQFQSNRLLSSPVLSEPKIRVMRLPDDDLNIEIVPQLENREVFNVYRNWTQVRFLDGRPLVLARSNNETQEVVSHPIEPPTPTPSDTEKTSAPVEIDYLWGAMGIGPASFWESMKITKLNVSIEEQWQGAGATAFLRQELQHGLWLDLDGSYYEPKGKRAFFNTYGEAHELSYSLARFRVRGGVGWNPLELMGINQLAIGPRLSGNFRQIPRLPLEGLALSHEDWKLENHRYSMWGGGLFARYSNKRFFSSLIAEYQRGDENSQEGYGVDLLLMHAIGKSRFMLGLGAAYQDLHYEACHEVRLICLAEGQVLTELSTSEISLAMAVGF